MTLEERLDAELKDAMRSGNNVAKLTIRAIKTALTEARVSGTEHRTLTDAEVLDIILKQVKQRRDSIAEFAKGGRTDLIANEEAEIAILEKYLPRQLDEAEIRGRAEAVIAELDVSGPKGMGPVMKRLTADLHGIAEGAVVSRIVRELLAQ